MLFYDLIRGGMTTTFTGAFKIRRRKDDDYFLRPKAYNNRIDSACIYCVHCKSEKEVVFLDIKITGNLLRIEFSSGARKVFNWCRISD